MWQHLERKYFWNMCESLSGKTFEWVMPITLQWKGYLLVKIQSTNMTDYKMYWYVGLIIERSIISIYSGCLGFRVNKVDEGSMFIMQKGSLPPTPLKPRAITTARNEESVNLGNKI